MTNKYEKNWRFLHAKYDGQCSFCRKQIFQFDEIFWNKYSKKVLHLICFKQPLKLFNTKLSAPCTVCRKKIYRNQKSFYDINKKKIVHTTCINMHEHILTESSKNIKNHIKEKLTKTQKNTNSKIFLTFNSNADNNSCTTYDGNQYEIILNGEIPLKVALEHELAHIIYKSHYGYSKYLGILDDWILSTGINSEQDTLLSNKILHRAFNIMEDIRIEYLDGLNDPHTQNSYERSLKNIGQSFLPDSEPNPLSFLLNKRFFREDLISDDFYVEMDIIFNKSKVNLVTKLLDVLKDWLNYGSLGYYILDEVRKKSEIY